MSKYMMFHREVFDREDKSLLRFALETDLLAEVILCRMGYDSNGVFFFPQEWNVRANNIRRAAIGYNGAFQLGGKLIRERKGWLVFKNGRYAVDIDQDVISCIQENHDADVFLVNADSSLSRHSEKIKLSTFNTIAGVKRLYQDSIEPASLSENWPHLLMISSRVIQRGFNLSLPVDFSQFLDECRKNDLRIFSFSVGGHIDDLESEAGLLKSLSFAQYIFKGAFTDRIERAKLSGSKIYGPVLLGKNIKIGKNVVILGPALIADDAIIEKESTICSSIIGPGSVVKAGTCLRHQVFRDSHTVNDNEGVKLSVVNPVDFQLNAAGNFQPKKYYKKWNRFSYVRFFKPILDKFSALVLLLIFLPIMPIIALMIKIVSKGPVFFGHKRQGFHGKEFRCIKFRTMIVNADEMQAKLRVQNEVDGPQFKMKEDPRITTVGHFLRETYLDEIPQLINVLAGHMSLIGPRPSPISENCLCAPWRDARLSVKPGMTGLWQICRTRSYGRDFQEWIHYDMKYVEKISPFLDALILLKTVKKVIESVYTHIFK